MPRFKERLIEAHYRSRQALPLWLWILWPFSIFYGLGVRMRLAAYRLGWLKSLPSPVPVISVGNLTTGGTGKTPIVIALASGLIRAGKKVLVLSRGYGAAQPVSGVRAGDPRHGDEACLIQEQVPDAVVMIGRDRVHTLRQALTEHRPDYVILDDGFQYLRLQREMNILLCDGEAMLGNERPLPMGPLREPLSEIRRADIIFVTRAVSPETLQTVESWIRRFHPNPNTPVLPVPFHVAGLRPVQSQQVISFDRFAGRTVIAFSGIARPDSFERDLNEAGLCVLAHQRFPDHHAYTEADVQKLLTLPNRHPAEDPVFITTEKDWPKVRSYFPVARLDKLYTLQTLPVLDGRWFYEEFLTQMPHHVSDTRSQTGSRHGAS